LIAVKQTANIVDSIPTDQRRAMKLTEITPGEKYLAKIPARVDRFLNEHLQDVIVTAEEIGLGYEVETYSASRVRGAGFTRTHKSGRKDGVRVRWEKQTGRSKFTGKTEYVNEGGTGVIPARNIERCPEWRIERETAV
jgi:hypothetical protein